MEVSWEGSEAGGSNLAADSIAPGPCEGPGEWQLCVDNNGRWEEAVRAGQDRIKAVLLLGDLGDKRAFDSCASLPGLARAWF